MKRKLNPYDYQQFNKLKEQLEREFPHIKEIGFYLKDFRDSSMATTALAASATFEFHGPDICWRIYRRSDTPEENIWDVDQVNYINRRVVEFPSKKDIVGHHISYSIEEDIMNRNRMLFEVVEDENGNFFLNKNSQNLVNTFINFEKPPSRDR